MQKTRSAVPSSPNDTQPVKSRMRPRWARVAAIAAAVFGVATVVSGASTLFGPQEVRAAAGAGVQFVLIDDCRAGVVIVVAAYALYRRRRWALGAAATIAGATAIVAIAFTVYTVSGGAFSWRTPGALLLRFGFWTAIAWGLFRNTQPTDRDA